MLWPAIILFAVATIISALGVLLAKRIAARAGLMDAPGHRKVHTVSTPRNGGIGIFLGFALPVAAGVAAVSFIGPADIKMFGDTAVAFVAKHQSGMIEQRGLAVLFLLCTLAIHIVGLADDRKAMDAWPKLLLQVGVAGLLVAGGEWLERGGFRVLTMLGDFPSGGFWLSALLSVLWIVALTNAFNFLDNMDGLSAGVAFIAAGMFLVAAAHNQQWFICALLIAFMGAVLGFLFFNFPPASIFMGDSGSMVLGFVLSALTIRTTFYEGAGSAWYAVLMPLFVMAVPLYDLVIVTVLRLARGRSPMQGDTNHFSHRLTRHGFSKRSAVLIIYGVTLATGVTAPLLARVDDVGAVLLAGQLLGMLTVIGVLERVGDHVK